MWLNLFIFLRMSLAKSSFSAAFRALLEPSWGPFWALIFSSWNASKAMWRRSCEHLIFCRMSLAKCKFSAVLLFSVFRASPDFLRMSAARAPFSTWEVVEQLFPTCFFFEDASGETLIFHAVQKYRHSHFRRMSQAKWPFLIKAMSRRPQFAEDVSAKSL